MRVFSGGIATETNTFGPMPTGMASFQDRGYYPGGTHPDHMFYFAGPLWAARIRGKERGWTLVEGLVAGAQPSGITTRATYERLRAELLADLRAALPVDMVLLGLHGAMVADGYDDCEGDLLAHVREIVGPDVVVGAELDPHNHLSQAMVDHADVLMSYKEYPHTDVLERAFELVDLCAAKVQGRIRPTAAVVDTDMIVTLHTSRQPARGFVDRIQAMEGQDGVLSISITHGFAWGDVPDMGTKVLVYTDGDAPKAARLARQLADELIALRDALSPHVPGIDKALDQAMAFEGGPVVLSDGADNPGGGAASDATFILQRLIERGITNVAIGPFWDPIAARIAIEAGEGARLPLRIGGKVSPLSGAPLDLDCHVLAVRHEHTQTGLSNTLTHMGDCALVEAKGIQILLVSLRNQAMGTDLFTGIGCDLASKKLIVVKSSQHFHASYSKVARHVIYAAAPGAVSFDLRSLPYRKVRRPKWPLDA
ncbi:M81 family metallopeptidase [Ramlibacter sp.]|uniref:M81 family metallopeptidase n=1 Tax=Ramlibacter sp. TaxID=1917967 RepID=UPI0035B33689